MKIVFMQDNGAAVMSPSQQLVEQVGINAVAEKDVPKGVPFFIVEEKDLPEDMTGWKPKGKPSGHGGDFGAGSENNFLGWTKDGVAITKEMLEAQAADVLAEMAAVEGDAQ